MQDRMRRESAEIAADPAEREEAERIREWARCRTDIRLCAGKPHPP